VIDDSDYYLVILGGRYGTLDAPGGKSYTHLEYEYALSAGKPTIALLHSHPSSLPAERTERTDDGQKRFEEFAAELKRKNYRYWKDRGELTTAVFTDVLQLKKTRLALGWTRSRAMSDEALKDELLRVRRELEQMGLELADANMRTAPTGVDCLEQGSDHTSIVIESPNAEHRLTTSHGTRLSGVYCHKPSERAPKIEILPRPSPHWRANILTGKVSLPRSSGKTRYFPGVLLAK